MILTVQVWNTDRQGIEWLKGFTERLGGNFDALKKPFNPCRMKSLGLIEDKPTYIIQIEPAWPRFSAYGAILTGLIFALGWPHWLLAPACLMMGIEVFWQPWFYLLMLKLGLRKAGSKAKVKKLSLIQAMEKIHFGAN
jgi:hypothetical protein